MPTHSVLSSARIMRLGAAGAPSLIEPGLPAVKELRLTTVRLPVNNPSGCNCWPTTYMVETLTNALVAPPGIGRVGTLPVVGSFPDCWSTRKIIGLVGSVETEVVVPPHSGPQLSTYAVLPSGEKTALMG